MCNLCRTFIEFVQNFHPAVKFTYKISEQSVAFLDMDISLKQGKLTTSIYYKATDSSSYLDYRSSHNPSTKNSIPSSRFLRLRRLCSDDTDFEEKAEQMVEFFIQRHYPEDIAREFCSSEGQNHSTSANSSAQRQNSYREETIHQSVVPPVHQPGTQNHPIQLESFAITHRISSDLQSATTDRIQTRH